MWCGGWDSNPRRPTPSGPKPDRPVRGRRRNNSDLEQHVPLSVKPSAPKLNDFLTWCMETASEDTCIQYVRRLQEPINKHNRWSVTAWKKWFRFLCEGGVEEACTLYGKIKSIKSKQDKYVPSLDEVKESLSKAEEPYRIVFWVLTQSGLRLNEVTYLLRNIDRLQVVEGDGFVRVKLDLERGTKKAFWAYLIKLPQRTLITAKEVSEYARKRKLLAPKYYRKFVATMMYKIAISSGTTDVSEIVDFIQGRTEAKVLSRNYLELLALADSFYPKYAEWLRTTFSI